METLDSIPKPTSNRVVLSLGSDDELKSDSGIVVYRAVQQVDRNKQTNGRVVAVGPGRKTTMGKRIPIQVELDDEVIFVGGAIQRTFKVGDDVMAIVEDRDISVVLGNFSDPNYKSRYGECFEGK